MHPRTLALVLSAFTLPALAATSPDLLAQIAGKYYVLPAAKARGFHCQLQLDPKTTAQMLNISLAEYQQDPFAQTMAKMPISLRFTLPDQVRVTVGVIPKQASADSIKDVREVVSGIQQSSETALMLWGRFTSGAIIPSAANKAEIRSNADGFQARIGSGKTRDELQLDPQGRITRYTPNAGLQKDYAILPSFRESPDGWMLSRMVYWPARAGKGAARQSLDTTLQYQQIGGWQIPALLGMKSPDDGELNVALTQCALN
ncbi:hypothetical protein [Paludibacterium sp. B53371]|uniref:hypothetical protein n=1 Tax=Paludibacterium sp. B53371 TaxID=2806263 RepID=UPI001C045149|nr:hypothetical protein [Paludibacterium sp. B53371]